MFLEHEAVDFNPIYVETPRGVYAMLSCIKYSMLTFSQNLGQTFYNEKYFDKISGKSAALPNI